LIKLKINTAQGLFKVGGLWVGEGDSIKLRFLSNTNCDSTGGIPLIQFTHTLYLSNITINSLVHHPSTMSLVSNGGGGFLSFVSTTRLLIYKSHNLVLYKVKVNHSKIRPQMISNLLQSYFCRTPSSKCNERVSNAF
jgi:hypothetical protein